MLSSDWVALLVATVLVVFSAIRTPTAIRGRNRPLWIAHILMIVCLVFAITPVYLFVDALLGNSNLANLLSHLLFGLIFYFGCQHVAVGIARPDLATLIASKASKLALGVLSIIMVSTFLGASLAGSSMGLNAYRGDWLVAAYKSVSFIYPMLCSVVLVGPLFAEASENVAVPWARRTALWCLCIGFGLVVPVPFIHAAEFWLPFLRGWVDLFIYSAVLFVALGPVIAFLTSRVSPRSGKKF